MTVPQTNPDALPFVDERQVRRNFARVAPHYRQADFLAREIDQRMAERLDYVKIEPQRILDLGCGDGASLAMLQQRYPEANLLGIDLVPEMLHAARAQTRQAEPVAKGASRFLRQLLPGLLGREHGPALCGATATALPLSAGSCSLLWSNQLLPWVNDPLPVLREAHRVLEVSGLLMFSTLGPDTLKELRGCFADGYTHTQRFFDMHDLGDMLAESGFADPVVDMEVLTLTYPDFDALIAELRQSGANCAMADRRPGLTSRTGWQQVRERYTSRHRNNEGRLPVTIEVIYGHAWKAQPKQTSDGRAIINFVKK